jgi:hypothetical protein
MKLYAVHRTERSFSVGENGSLQASTLLSNLGGQSALPQIAHRSVDKERKTRTVLIQITSLICISFNQ